ncbi:rod shape-determining protein MreD [Curvivirga aplysinae]|uniref:rod shape-determining protein MreD n=1 Tax=Curvivirga aplysinae TaxID=2529852 RepID=UPI0012BCE627|nr:rod shape-determining protein MreD [Curvivirga aplysinae]MTI08687.1 rod shape-determining protein MreD [Curvivirga aplysinae]
MISQEQTIWSRIDHFARSSLPLLVTVIAVVLGVIPLHLPDSEVIKPMLVLACVYYWTIYRPDLMPMFLVFIIGLFQDLLYGSPIGISSFVYLIVAFLVGTQRRFFHGKTFGIVWWGFMVVAVLAAILFWVVFCILVKDYVSPMSFIFRYLMSLAWFPIAFVVMVLVHKLIPPRGQ